MAEPGTIQFSTESVGGGALGAQPGVPQVGIQGGGTGTVGPVRSGAGWFDSVGGMTTELGGNLPEFIEQAFAPALQATARKREWEGFVAARAGKTAEEINENKPWYSKLFGPSNYEIGVATYTVQKQAADIEADLIRRMPELRKMTPQQWADELNALSEQHLTGNPYADTVLRKTFMDRAGPLTDLYTKERSAFENQELLRTQVDSATASVDAYQELASRVAQLGESHPDMPEMEMHLEEARLKLADSLTPSMFQTDESVSAMYNAVGSYAAQGKFYALNVLEDAGYRDSLSIERREAFDQTVRQGRAQWLASRPIDDTVMREMTELSVEANLGILSAEEAAARAHDLNRRHTARTGDRKPLIDLGDATQLTGSALGAFYGSLRAEANARKAAEEKANTELERERLRQEGITRAAASWKIGNIGELVHAEAVTESQAEQAAMAHYRTNPVEALQAQVNSYANPGFRYISKTVKAAVQQGIQADPDLDWTPAFDQSYEQFKIMEQHQPPLGGGRVDTTSGPNAAREIFGDDNVALFREYERLVDQKVERPTAYKMAQMALSRDPVGRGDVSKDQYEQLQKELKPSNAVWRAITGETPLTYKGALLTTAVQEIPKLQRTFPGQSDEWYAKAARQKAEAAGVDIAGEFTWNRRPDQKPITAYAGDVAPDVYGTALRQYMARAAHKANVDMDSNDTVLLVSRQADSPDGFPILVMMAQDKRGRVFQGTFRRQDFEKVQQEAAQMREQMSQPNNEAYRASGLFYGDHIPMN